MRPLTGIFLDTGNLEEVRKYHALGIIRGVTTNPTLLVKEGITTGLEGVEERCREIAQLVDPLPVSVEVTSNDEDEMLQQAREFTQWARNINVKIPIHGPEGGTDNLKLVHQLETEYNIRVNVTAIMSGQQGLLAAMAGATYVSLFAGRVNNIGYDSRVEIRRLRNLLDAFESPARLIAGSTREILNIVEWFEAGADIVTSVPTLLEGMLVHPYSKETVQQFVRDGQRLQQAQRAKAAPSLAGR